MTTINKTFSFFGKGHYSEREKKCVPAVTPQQTVSIEWVFQYIISERARWATEELRGMIGKEDDQQLRDFKLLNFDAVTAAGRFSYGSAAGLIVRSPYIVMDLDDFGSSEEARHIQQLLIKDTNVVTALCFLSPKGLGCKWWVEVPEWCIEMTFTEQYKTLSRYLGYEYGILADPTCSNVNRLCFLPYDDSCYINPKYLRV